MVKLTFDTSFSKAFKLPSVNQKSNSRATDNTAAVLSRSRSDRVLELDCWTAGFAPSCFCRLEGGEATSTAGAEFILADASMLLMSFRCNKDGEMGSARDEGVVRGCDGLRVGRPACHFPPEKMSETTQIPAARCTLYFT